MLYLTGVNRKELDSYYIEFQENISGLGEGSKVTYNGVPVGKVTGLKVTQANRVGVTIGVDPSKVTLREGVMAKYSMETLFGPFVIDLFGSGGTDSQPLKPGSEIEVQRSILSDIEQSVPDTLTRAKHFIEVLTNLLAEVDPKDIPDIINQVKTILAETNRTITTVREEIANTSAGIGEAIKTAREEFQSVSATASATVKKINTTAEEATKLIQTLQKTIDENRASLRNTLHNLDQAVARVQKDLGKVDLAATEKSIREAVAEVSQAAEAVDKAATAIAATAETTGTTSKEVRRSMANVERSLVRSLDELERTLHAARGVLDILERDPSVLIRGRAEQPKE
jgi:phospholipid/cholesterol/gamma-HCH transport system substrate-binding protein